MDHDDSALSILRKCVLHIIGKILTLCRHNQLSESTFLNMILFTQEI